MSHGSHPGSTPAAAFSSGVQQVREPIVQSRRRGGPRRAIQTFPNKHGSSIFLGRRFMKMIPAPAVWLILAPALFAQNVELPPPVRIESGVSGHIHPALAITNKGTLVAVYCKSEYK